MLDCYLYIFIVFFVCFFSFLNFIVIGRFMLVVFLMKIRVLSYIVLNLFNNLFFYKNFKDFDADMYLVCL